MIPVWFGRRSTLRQTLALGLVSARRRIKPSNATISPLRRSSGSPDQDEAGPAPSRRPRLRRLDAAFKRGITDRG